VAGESVGRSDVGEDVNDDTDDGVDDESEVGGIGDIDVAVIVEDRSRVFTLEINCPRCLGCVSQCFARIGGASLSL
jgi:hypothetical protein